MADQPPKNKSGITRADEKAAQRAADEDDIRSGRATSNEVNQRNSLFGGLNIVKYSIAKPVKSGKF